MKQKTSTRTTSRPSKPKKNSQKHRRRRAGVKNKTKSSGRRLGPKGQTNKPKHRQTTSNSKAKCSGSRRSLSGVSTDKTPTKRRSVSRAARKNRTEIRVKEQRRPRVRRGIDRAEHPILTQLVLGINEVPLHFKVKTVYRPTADSAKDESRKVFKFVLTHENTDLVAFACGSAGPATQKILELNKSYRLLPGGGCVKRRRRGLKEFRVNNSNMIFFNDASKIEPLLSST